LQECGIMAQTPQYRKNATVGEIPLRTTALGMVLYRVAVLTGLGFP
jgi:hypothetical protein